MFFRYNYEIPPLSPAATVALRRDGEASSTGQAHRARRIRREGVLSRASYLDVDPISGEDYEDYTRPPRKG